MVTVYSAFPIFVEYESLHNFCRHDMRIWFWQRIVTPHMADLASEIARLGCQVTYVAEQMMSPDRANQGWFAPELNGVKLEIAPSASELQSLALCAPEDSVHICQGIRGNGRVSEAQKILRQRKMRQWVVMETVEDSGMLGVAKRLEYRRLFTKFRKHIRGVLAIGHVTPSWLERCGVDPAAIFPFAYFLKDEDWKDSVVEKTSDKFRFIFVGRLIELKNVDLLLKALHEVRFKEFEVEFVGAGHLEANLKTQAADLIPGRVIWTGRLPFNRVRERVANADCLVLPSSHDGWGAVVSEALMVGTPVICSDACGAAGVVEMSGVGGVFPSGDVGALAAQLAQVVVDGCITTRQRFGLVSWAKCLGAEAGARYLLDILMYDDGKVRAPLPPWSRFPLHMACGADELVKNVIDA